MPLYTVDVQKKQGTEYWTNRWVVSSPSLGQASVLGGEIAGHELSIHTTNVLIDRYRTRPLVPGGDNYIIVPVGYNGGYEGGTLASQIPLFNVVRVDWAVAEGRPSRKYFRTGLTESMVDGSVLVEAYRVFVDGRMEDLRITLAGALVDVDGQAINDATVFPAVGMRQLRRGSRRRLTPII